jgi:prolyl oligopeptidase
MKLILLLCSAALALAAAQPARAVSADKLAPIGLGKPPAPLPPQPVTETLFGTTVTDKYRFMETLSPPTIDWMKTQGAYTRKVFDAIPKLAALQARVAAFTGSFGVVQGYASFGGRAFYQERAPGSDNFDLVVRDAAGTRKLVDVAALRAKNRSTPMAINFFLPSPDGSKVGVGISAGGSEDASLFVYDAKTGAQIAGPIDRAQFGATSWSDDSKTLYFVRLKALKPGEPGTEKYRGASLDAWALTAPPVPLFGALTGHGPAFTPDETPILAIQPGAPMAVLQSQNGVQNEVKLWLAPAAQVNDPATKWAKLADRDDGITSFDLRGNEVFLLSHKDAPTFKVLALKAGAPLAAATTLVPPRADRVVEGVHAAADALYVVTRQGVYSHLLRIPAGATTIEDIALPTKGHISEVFSDPRFPGISLALESWVIPPTELHYDPATKRFTDLHLGVHGDIDPATFKVSDLQARAHDGVMVPLSLIQPASAHGRQITIIEAYGSYGISELADFSPRRAAPLREGISYAICHVRGGGELGEAWRLGGKDANKHNTWQDLIACTESLIASGETAKDRVFILGGSAGGITMGRAMTERPDLFAGVMDLVPAANTLRAEFSPNGPDNIPEFGTITTRQGFQNLNAEDSIQHVKPGVAYPAVMITTGLNDPRVSPWEPAKFAAALMASGDPNPVLLRVDAAAGHGIGSTRTQGDQLTSDTIAFAFWRSGVPGWRPEGRK